LSACFGHGNSVTRFRYIQSDKNLAILSHGSSPCAEARLAHASNPR
jgi:hypothetical protein